MTSSQCNVLELGLISPPFCSMEKFVIFNYWTHNFSFPTCERRHWSSSYRISLAEQSSYLSRDFLQLSSSCRVKGIFSALEVWIIRYLLHWGAQRDFKATVTLHRAYIASSHAAGFLQVAWKSFKGQLALDLGIGPRAQVGMCWDSESCQVSVWYLFAMCSGLHQSLDL